MNENLNTDNAKPVPSVDELCAKMQEYSECEDIKSVLHEVKELHNAWENMKNDRQKEDSSEKYKKAYKKYFSRLKFLQQTEDWERWENYTKKMLLCEKIEKLRTETDFYKISRDASDIWNQWRHIGTVPKELNEEIWNRFSSVRNELNEKCRAFFETQKEEQEKNLAIKKDLCAKAEALKDSREWEKTAEELKHLQEEWKKAGRAPQPFNDELFEAFRASCNLFFKNRIDHYNDLHSRQAENKKYKKELCTEAEQLNSLPYEQAVKKVRELKSAWNDIGSSGKKDEEKLWNAFNETIDAYFSRVDAERPANLENKQKICSELEALLNDQSVHADIVLFKSKIDELKNQWNKIGHVPKEQENDIRTSFSAIMKRLSAAYYSARKDSLTKYIDELYMKEQLIDEVEKLIGQPDAVTKSEEIKSRWGALEARQIPQNEMDKLNARFNSVLQHVSSGTAEHLASIEKNRSEALKQRIKLCIQMEQLAGHAESDDDSSIKDTPSTLSLAEELKLAIENNFASPKPGRNSQEQQPDKYENILRKWNESGEISLNEFKSLYNRFYMALNKYEEKNKGV